MIYNLLSKKRGFIVALITFLAVFSQEVMAQCNPTFSGSPCVNSAITFNANSPGFTTWAWNFGDAAPGTSTARDPVYSYTKEGTYTVTYNSSGPAGTCSKTLTVVVKAAPTINVNRINCYDQCFAGNSFCFNDSSEAVPGSSVVRGSYVFSDGGFINELNPKFPKKFCYSVKDPRGGTFDLAVEMEDSNGCIARKVYPDAIKVWPKLGVSIRSNAPTGCDSTTATIINLTFTNWQIEPDKFIGLKYLAKFEFDFGDGTVIIGDSNTNTEFWTGLNNDGIIRHKYRSNGTFDAKLKVISIFGCEEEFTYKAAATNIKIAPVIIADYDSSCVGNPVVNFSLKNGPVPGAQFLWNFGHPPSGNLNTNFRSWTPSHSYGSGPWMTSLRIIVGPCDIMIYDTIIKIGPASIIEVSGNRVPICETYQCVIKDSVHFPNNSTFYHDDPDMFDEDSFKLVYVYDTIGYTTARLPLPKGGNCDYPLPVRVTYPVKVNAFKFVPPPPMPGVGDQTTLTSPAHLANRHNDYIFRLWTLGDNYAPKCTTDTRANKNVNRNCNFTMDSLPVHWYTPWDEIYKEYRDGQNYKGPVMRTLFSKNARRCYQVSVYPSDTITIPADTLLIVPFGQDFTYNGHYIDSFSKYPEKTYDSTTWTTFRVKRPPAYFGARTERIREIFPIFKLDTVLWLKSNYRWVKCTGGVLPTEVYDSVPTYVNDKPYYERTNVRMVYCYRGQDSVLLYDSTLRHKYDFIIWKKENIRWQYPSTTDSIQLYDSTAKVNATFLKNDTVFYNRITPITWTVTFDDEDFRVPAGVKVRINNVETGASKTVTGPTTLTIKKWEQFALDIKDTIYPLIKVITRKPDVTFAGTSTIIKDTSYSYWDTANAKLVTVDTFRIYNAKVIDEGYHRDFFYLNTAQCNTVTLYQRDTVHPLHCESTATKSLALIPPNARGLKWESGTPCPLDGDKLQYYLTFDMSETKPGCSQFWFAVNYDSLNGPNDWNHFNGGNVLAPPPPGIPIPFILPYDIVSNFGTKFVKGYTPLEVGQDPKKRPKGSFTIGLAVGNGCDTSGGKYPAMCMDTAWYTDMFRILYLNADFEILVPAATPKFLCAGDTAYFRIVQPIQDSIAAIRWNWGYQDRTMGYFEEWKYYQPYLGPSATRNDKDVIWKGEKWLYNYVIRSSIDDVNFVVTLDTIVRSIMRDWQTITNTDRADDLIKDAFKSIGLDLRDIPKSDVSLYLGDGTFGCIDTTGLSQFFDFGIRGYNDSITATHGRYKYLFLNPARTDSIIIEEILHFRDSSIQGFDTLIRPNDSISGKIDTIMGVYRFVYRHPVLVKDPCDPNKTTVEWKKSSGPMGPNLFINNTVGCEKRGSALLNVGFLSWFKMAEDAVCKGTPVRVLDSIRYWQLGDADILYYPIDRFPYWEDPTRYINNRETKSIDWDATDGVVDFERSIKFTHNYDVPGEYLIHVAMKDSLGCLDTASFRTYVTGIKAGFENSNNTDQCKQIISFFDTTQVYDPCKLKDTCKNANYDPCDYIVEWLWDFGDGTRTSVLQSPTHNYTTSGYFTVKLIVKSFLGCEDSIEQTIFILGPQPDFDILNSPWGKDSIIICVNDSVSLLNTSRQKYYNPDWIFSWGDSSINSTTSTKVINDTAGHRYRTPGVYYLSLTMVDTIEGTALRCSRVFPDNSEEILDPRVIKVIVLPRAPADFIMSDSIICPNEAITFTEKSDTLYKRYSWYFGDGDTSTIGPVVTHPYAQSGKYKVTLVPDYDPIGFVPKCVDTATKSIQVIDVEAKFDVDSTNKPEFCFKNKSVNGIKFTWIIEDRPNADRISNEVDVCHTWGERVGTYKVCLIAESPEGCIDTTCELVNNQFFLKLIPYNVFTPSKDGNGDGKNDRFFIDVKGQDAFEIKIFNRWGEVVYQSTNADQGWDGTIMNKGKKICPEGAYFYMVNYTMKNRQENDGRGPVSGTVTLIRED